MQELPGQPVQLGHVGVDPQSYTPQSALWLGSPRATCQPLRSAPILEKSIEEIDAVLDRIATRHPLEY